MTLEPLHNLLSRVAEGEPPEDRDEAWSEIVRQYRELEGRLAEATEALARWRAYVESVKQDPDYDIEGFEWEDIYTQTCGALRAEPATATPSFNATLCPTDEPTPSFDGTLAPDFGEKPAPGAGKAGSEETP